MIAYFCFANRFKGPDAVMQAHDDLVIGMTRPGAGQGQLCQAVPIPGTTKYRFYTLRHGPRYSLDVNPGDQTKLCLAPTANKPGQSWTMTRAWAEEIVFNLSNDVTGPGIFITVYSNG